MEEMNTITVYPVSTDINSHVCYIDMQLSRLLSIEGVRKLPLVFLKKITISGSYIAVMRSVAWFFFEYYVLTCVSRVHAKWFGITFG